MSYTILILDSYCQVLTSLKLEIPIHMAQTSIEISYRTITPNSNFPGEISILSQDLPKATW